VHAAPASHNRSAPYCSGTLHPVLMPMSCCISCTALAEHPHSFILRPASRLLTLALLTLFFPAVLLQDQTAKECGLHSGNIVSSAEAQAAGEAADLWAAGSAVEGLDHDALAQLADGSRDKDTLVVLYAPWCQFSQVRFWGLPTSAEVHAAGMAWGAG